MHTVFPQVVTPASPAPAEPLPHADLEAMTVLDAMHQHIALLDHQGTVIAVNRAWREFGQRNAAADRPGGCVGVNYLSVCERARRLSPAPGAEHEPDPEPEAALARAGIAAVLDGTQAGFELEYPCHTPDAEHRFLMRVAPLAGQRRGVVVSHEDITARWRLEQQRASLIAELLSANRELGEFAHVVSHDLKAPLRGISSLANWLVADYSDKLGAEGCGQLALIASRVKRLSGLIDAILAYSRAGRSQVEREAVPLEPLVRNTIDLLAPPPHIRVEIASPLPQLTIQAVKIQQVFQNLLSNAIDFMDKENGLVTLACVREGAVWHFSVSDNGPGIESRHFERIFQLFQTLNARDQVERTGVGLALVKKIVELEGGRLWVESSLGSGTTFHFTLAAQADGPGQPTPPDRP